jgi:hypothetical protein
VTSPLDFSCSEAQQAARAKQRGRVRGGGRRKGEEILGFRAGCFLRVPARRFLLIRTPVNPKPFSTMSAVRPALTQEQLERMEKNRQMALERKRKFEEAAASAAAPVNQPNESKRLSSASTPSRDEEGRHGWQSSFYKVQPKREPSPPSPAVQAALAAIHQREQEAIQQREQEELQQRRPSAQEWASSPYDGEPEKERSGNQQAQSFGREETWDVPAQRSSADAGNRPSAESWVQQGLGWGAAAQQQKSKQQSFLSFGGNGNGNERQLSFGQKPAHSSKMPQGLKRSANLEKFRSQQV